MGGIRLCVWDIVVLPIVTVLVTCNVYSCFRNAHSFHALSYVCIWVKNNILEVGCKDAQGINIMKRYVSLFQGLGFIAWGLLT